jgi:hypothetical protein
MSNQESRRKEILQLLASGKITAQEASDLLADVQSQPEVEEAPEEKIGTLDPEEKLGVRKGELTGAQEPRWLRVEVNDLATGRRKVTVNLPLRLVRFGLDVGSRFAPEMKGLDWDELSEMMRQEKGILVDVMDEEDGEHVQVYVD